MNASITHNASANTEEPISIALLRTIGAELFREGYGIEECLTIPEREGYQAAMYAAADADTEKYLLSVNWGQL